MQGRLVYFHLAALNLVKTELSQRIFMKLYTSSPLFPPTFMKIIPPFLPL
jgi:hypothetical protein